MLRIIISADEASCERYCDDITKYNPMIVGLDCEYADFKCELIQICVPGLSSKYEENVITYNDLISIPETRKYAKDGTYTVYLFCLLNYKTMPDKFKKLLSNNFIIKVGCGIVNDHVNILNEFQVNLHPIIDSRDVVKVEDIYPESMDKLARCLFGDKKYSCKPGKDSDEFIKYSAYDAYLSLVIYFGLTSGITKFDFPHINPDLEDFMDDIKNQECAVPRFLRKLGLNITHYDDPTEAVTSYMIPKSLREFGVTLRVSSDFTEDKDSPADGAFRIFNKLKKVYTSSEPLLLHRLIKIITSSCEPSLLKLDFNHSYQICMAWIDYLVYMEFISYQDHKFIINR